MRAARQRAVFRRRRGLSRRGQTGTGARRLNVSSDGYSEDGGRYRVYVNVPRGNGSQTSAGTPAPLLTRAVQTYARQNPAAQAELMPAGYAGYHHRDETADS